MCGRIRPFLRVRKKSQYETSRKGLTQLLSEKSPVICYDLVALYDAVKSCDVGASAIKCW